MKYSQARVIRFHHEVRINVMRTLNFNEYVEYISKYFTYGVIEFLLIFDIYNQICILIIYYSEIIILLTF